MTHTNLIANELSNSGFKTYIVEIKFSGTALEAVEASLDNRKVSRMEVRETLEQKFEGINFNLTSTYNGVLVTE